MSARVLISIVTYNSARHIEACFQSLREQAYENFRISVWDNASVDETRSILESRRDLIGSIHFSDRNAGFCEAHNRMIESAECDYVLVLNPDVRLTPLFLEKIIGGMERDPGAGSATGKLYRHPDGRILDTTGIYFTPSQRHLDRGSNEIDTGQYDKAEYVFGASGAAALYRREMLEEVRDGNEFFDESFFAYREDADLAWRAQWMGWRCLYVPEAIGYHERRVLPENRFRLPDPVNMHSFKNRFLLRIKNMDAGTYARFIVPITLRDAAALLYVVLREWSSLPAIPRLIAAFPRAWASRKSIRSRRRISPREIRSWFSYKPVAREIRSQAPPAKPGA